MVTRAADATSKARPLWAGLVSFGLAVVVTFLGFARVNAIAAAPTSLRLTLLLLLFWGVAAGFTHGVGLLPGKPLWRAVLGPLCGWPLLIGVLVALLTLI